MLRLLSILTGTALASIGAWVLLSSFDYLGTQDVIIALAMVAGGLVVVVNAAGSTHTKNKSLLAAWIDLKRAEISAKHDAINRGSK